MRDFVNEMMIKYHLWRMCNTRGEKQKAHMREMYKRISLRSKSYVSNLERKSGL